MTRKTLQTVAVIIVGTIALSGCAGLQQTYEENPKAILGGALGAGAGAGIAALAGASPAWIVGSALMGGLLGGAIGHGLDNRDKQMATEAANRAFQSNRTGQASVWNNPDTGNSGSVTPTKTYQLANGEYCREYTQTITIGGTPQKSYGTACRQADGSWKVES